MNEKIYIIIKISKNCPALNYYTGEPTNDLEMHVEALVGVFDTYQAALEGKNSLVKSKPGESFYIMERLVGRIHTPHEFRKFIEGPPVEYDDAEYDE